MKKKIFRNTNAAHELRIPKAFKYAQLPTYQYQGGSALIVADLLFKPQVSQAIANIMTSRQYQMLMRIFIPCSLFINLLILFGVLPSLASYCYLISVVTYCCFVFLGNVEVLCLLCKSWDCWFITFQGLAFATEFCMLFPDHRMVLGIGLGLIRVFVWGTIDSWPDTIRTSLGFSGGLMTGTYYMLLLAGVHFNVFPNINDFEFQFHSIKWNVRQMFESTTFILIALCYRLAFLAFLFPRDYFFLKLSVRK